MRVEREVEVRGRSEGGREKSGMACREGRREGGREGRRKGGREGGMKGRRTGEREEEGRKGTCSMLTDTVHMQHCELPVHNRWATPPAAAPF